jgi:hypothetical protein
MSDKVLRIGVIQGVNVIEERVVRTRGPVSFGTAPGNTFVLQGSDLPRSVTVFEVKGDKYYLAFGTEQSGQIERHPGQGEKLASLTGNAEKSGDKYRVPLDETSRGRIKLSAEITVLFHFVPAPAAAAAPELPVDLKGGLIGQIEPVFTAVLLASFLIHAAFGIVVKIAEPPKPPELEDLRRLVETITPPKVEAQKINVIESNIKIGAGTKEPEKASGEGSGGGGPPGKKKGGGGGVGDRAALRDAIAGRGILQLIGGRGGGCGGGAVGSVFGSGTAISDDIGTALAGTGGVGIAGNGSGVTRRGEGGGCGGGGGGCGGAADIGSLATSGGGNVDTGAKQAARIVARVRSDDVEAVDGKVDKKGVAATIRRRQEGFQACYEEALKANSKLQGKLVVEFTIGDGGKVTDARVVKDGLGSAQVSTCVVGLLKRLRFPAPSDGEVTISNSFVFQPGG